MSAALLVSALAGACGSSTSLLESIGGSSATPEAQQTTSRKLERTVSYRPALGPPDTVNSVLSRQLNLAALEQGIALIIDPNVTAELTLRGYVGALSKGEQVGLTYVWDILDSRGQRVNRIAGEETIPSAGSDPWSAFTPDVARALALKTMGELGQWTRSNPVQRTTAPTVASGSSSTPPAGAGIRPAALAPSQ